MVGNESLRVGITIVFLAAASMHDSLYRRIPNRLNIAGMAAAVFLLITDFSGRNAGQFLLGMILPAAICWIPFRMHALGAGDFKVFVVTGCLIGSGFDALLCIFFSFLLAAGFSLSRLLSLRQLFSSLNNFFYYIQNLKRERKIMPYPGRISPGHCIPIAPTVLGGFLILLGVKICRIIR